MVNFWDILQETGKSSAYWDMDENSHVTWLSSKAYIPPEREPIRFTFHVSCYMYQHVGIQYVG